MKYPNRSKEVNAVLDVARAIRHLGKATDFNVTDLASRLDEPAGDHILELLEIILDYEEGESRGEDHQA
jgi:hypothetical protein